MSRFRTIEFLAASTAPMQKEIRAIEEAVAASLPKEFKVFLHDALPIYCIEARIGALPTLSRSLRWTLPFLWSPNGV